MRAVIISPYFETLGGGERYALTFAQALLDRGWQAEVATDSLETIEIAKKRFSLGLEGLKVTPLEHFLSGNLLKRLACQRKYDLVFWVSDGSIPWMAGSKNILHFQVPFHDVKGKSFFNLLKFKMIDKVVCNSLFTKKVIDHEFGITSDVWYPPVSIGDFLPGKKKNYILAVGRFEKSMTEKRQDILIDAFKEVFKKGLKNWKLILCGGCALDNKNYLTSLQQAAEAFPIEFKVNIPFSELKKLYSDAKIFWHAAGYGVDEEKFPEKTEHFGMTTVEAMASGCIPLVLGKGGQKEIITEGENGFFWFSEEELVGKTLTLVKNPKALTEISLKAQQKSKDFSKEEFYQKVYSFIR